MAVCPKCESRSVGTLPGQLCAHCRDQVLAMDHYSPGDLRFVGILTAMLTAAVASLPGALVGYLIGALFEERTRGCTIGVLVFVLLGLALGYRIGPGLVAPRRRIEKSQAN